MLAPINEAHVKAFHWFAAGWLLAVVGCTVIVVVSGGYEWTRVARTALSLGVMPLVSAGITISIGRWLRRSTRV
jgi:hypothetical protein